MSKRFCDTELYEKDWFLELPPEYKLFWEYITKKCETSGVWDVNLVMAKMILGQKEKVDIQDFAKKCNQDGKERIIVFNGGKKLFITTTISFQVNGKLNDKIPAHRGIINQLNEHDETKLWFNQQLSNGNITLTKGLDKGNATLKDKDKDKDKDKENINKGVDENFLEMKSINGGHADVNIVYPFDSIKFHDAWKSWRQHLLDMGKNYKGFTAEQMELKNLSQFAKKDEAKAIKVIEWAISKQFKSLNIDLYKQNQKSNERLTSDQKQYLASRKDL